MKTQQGRMGFYSMIIFTLALFPISRFLANSNLGKVGMMACALASFYGVQTFFQASMVVRSFLENEENNQH